MLLKHPLSAACLPSLAAVSRKQLATDPQPKWAVQFLAHLSPLGWEHINLTGDYHWDSSPAYVLINFRPLRTKVNTAAAAA